MGIVQNIIDKIKNKKAVKTDYAEQQNAVSEYDNKKMNSNERELRRYYEEQRQKRIKKQLEGIRTRENRKAWSGRNNNPVYAKNVIAGQKKLFGTKDNLTRQGNQCVYKNKNVINCKNITKGGKKLFTINRRGKK